MSLSKLNAAFAASAFLLSSCNLVGETDRYSFTCFSPKTHEIALGVFSVPAGYAVSVKDGATNKIVEAVKGSDKVAKEVSVAPDSSCDLLLQPK